MSSLRLALLVICASLLLAQQASAATAPCAGGDVRPDGTNEQVVAAATLCLLNEERAAEHLHLLRANAALARLASSYAADMVQRQFFAHVTPGGITITQRLAMIGYDWQDCGENLAWGQAELSTPAQIFNAWMHSPPHRADILDPTFREVGVGVAPGAPVPSSLEAGTYVTDFGTPMAGATASSTVHSYRVVRHRFRHGRRAHHRRHRPRRWRSGGTLGMAARGARLLGL